MGRMDRWCSRSGARAVEVGDSMTVPDVGKAIVGQAAYCLTQSIISRPYKISKHKTT